MPASLQNQRQTSTSRNKLTCRQQLWNLALHEAQLADKDIQNPAQLQAVGFSSSPVSMPSKHDFHDTVQQLDAGALSGHRCIWILQVPASKGSRFSIRVTALPACCVILMSTVLCRWLTLVP